MSSTSNTRSAAAPCRRLATRVWLLPYAENANVHADEHSAGHAHYRTITVRQATARQLRGWFARISPQIVAFLAEFDCARRVHRAISL
ncbi:hypothetical protein chiPu_0030085, partial [Chiloscyllium punctatum]|nr:hypothetical protein [Chiloscyllium punctatum]